MEHEQPDPLRARLPLTVLTGGSGQLGAALREELPWLQLARRDGASPDLDRRPDLILHAGAWTDVDGAEHDRAGAEQGNVDFTRSVVSWSAPVVYYSSDYVFDGTKGSPYLESDAPCPLGVYGETKLRGEQEVKEGWIVRSSWLFGWTSRNFVRTMLELGATRDEVSVVDDQRGCPTYVGHLAAATRELLQRELPYGTYHLAADGDCSWADFAEAIFELAGLPCRVVRITSDELERPARRPAYSVLRSEHPEAPRLPHWRAGLVECLARLLR